MVEFSSVTAPGALGRSPGTVDLPIASAVPTVQATTNRPPAANAYAPDHFTEAAVPKTAAMNRQPKEWKPKALIPTAMIHLPSGGWTKDCSVGWVVPQNVIPLPRYRQASLA